MSITASNIVIALSIPNLFDVPQQIQGFASDDVFSTDPIAPAETQMGVDGLLSGGYVFVPTMQSFALMPDSRSNDFFDQWFAATKAFGDNYTANGVILITSIARKWTMTKGFLTGYPMIPDAKKLLQPRRFQITWESVDPAPV